MILFHYGDLMSKKTAKRATRPNPREDRNTVVDFEAAGRRRKRVELLPRSIAQEAYVDALIDDAKALVFAMGPAGCGKTMLATQRSIMGLQSGEFDRIVITRPAVSVDEQHGFLPGSLVEKMAPWMMPILDVFKEHYSPKEVAAMIADEVIDICPLAYMRGRTFKNSFIIFDEAQNSTPNQTKMVLTRIGEGSRMVITGDLRQHDRGYEANGLKDFVDRLALTGSPHIAVCEFDAGDVERHAIIAEVLRIYGDAA